MNLQPGKSNSTGIVWIAALVSVLAAIAYFLIAQDRLGIGDVEMAKDGDVIIYIASASYLVGGVLILIRKRWLWVIGAIANALVVLFFFRMYQSRPLVMSSQGGLATKVPEILLELVLLFLILSDWLCTRNRNLE